MNAVRAWLSASLACGIVSGALAPLDAACPCNRGGNAAMAVSQVEVGHGFAPGTSFDPIPPPPVPAFGAPGPMGAPPAYAPAMPAPTLIAPPAPQGPSSEPIGTAIPGTNRFGMTPPPGTLGKTYQRRTTLLPDEKHPRIAMVDVHLPESADVTARGLKSKWTGEVWRLETEAPLLPGVPHIYAIKAEKTLPNGQKQVDVRWVRLIMGRVVDLEF